MSEPFTLTLAGETLTVPTEPGLAALASIWPVMKQLNEESDVVPRAVLACSIVGGAMVPPLSPASVQAMVQGLEAMRAVEAAAMAVMFGSGLFVQRSAGAGEA